MTKKMFWSKSRKSTKLDSGASTLDSTTSRFLPSQNLTMNSKKETNELDLPTSATTASSYSSNESRLSINSVSITKHVSSEIELAGVDEETQPLRHSDLNKIAVPQTVHERRPASTADRRNTVEIDETQEQREMSNGSSIWTSATHSTTASQTAARVHLLHISDFKKNMAYNGIFPSPKEEQLLEMILEKYKSQAKEIRNLGEIQGRAARYQEFVAGSLMQQTTEVKENLRMLSYDHMLRTLVDIEELKRQILEARS